MQTVAIGGLGAIGLKLARALDAGVEGLRLIAVAAVVVALCCGSLAAPGCVSGRGDTCRAAMRRTWRTTATTATWSSSASMRWCSV